MATEFEARLERLETRLAWQEDAVAELSRQAFEREKRIDRLEATVRKLSERLRDSGGLELPPPEDERPPHY
ncbi:MAG: SlyX family protein [Spirochaetales bacterium]|nr:SlyX family protein [Spirochaetales bacterium]